MNILKKFLPVLAPEVGTGAAPPSSPTPNSPSPSSGGSSQPSSSTGSPSGAPSSPSQPSAPATASPTAPSAPAPVPTPDAGGGVEAMDFSAIFGETEPVVAPAPAVPAAPAAPPAAQPQQLAPAPAPQAPATPAAEVAPVAAPSPQGPDAAASASPHLDPADPIAVAHALSQNEQAAIDFVAANTFKLTPEDIEALESDVVGTIPKLLARGFVKAQHNMLTQMGRIIPMMIQRHQQVTQRNSEHETKFFGRWPDLKPEAHGNLVRSYGAVYRKMHPNASTDDMIEALGPMVMMAAKVVPTTPQAGAPVAASPLLANPMANGSRPPQPQPFLPALGGGGAVQQQEVEEPWMAIHTHQE